MGPTLKKAALDLYTDCGSPLNTSDNEKFKKFDVQIEDQAWGGGTWPWMGGPIGDVGHLFSGLLFISLTRRRRGLEKTTDLSQKIWLETHGDQPWLWPEVLGAVVVGVAAVGVAGLLGKMVYDYFNKKPDTDNKIDNKEKKQSRQEL